MNYDFLPLTRRKKSETETAYAMPEFTVSSKAKETLIYPKSFCLLEASSGQCSGQSGRELYELRYTLKGEGYLTYGERQYPLKKGEGCLIDCRQKHAYQTGKDLWLSTSLCFNGAPAAPLVQSYLQSGSVIFTDAMFTNFEPLQMHILQCTQKTSSYMEYEVSCTFYLLLTNLLIAQSKVHSTPETIEKIISYMQANYMKDLTADGLSHHFGLSRAHMTRCFKEYTGSAPHEYLTRLRIYNAKHLLKTTELSIEEISRQTGFSDSVYFIQVFKKREGMTPSRFRKT